MPLAIADGGRKIRRTISRRTEIAASFGPPAVGVASSAKRSRAASDPPTTKLPTVTKSAATMTGSAAPMGASESAAMEAATATAAAMETATATAVTAATTVLGGGWAWIESETNEDCECD